MREKRNKGVKVCGFLEFNQEGFTGVTYVYGKSGRWSEGGDGRGNSTVN